MNKLRHSTYTHTPSGTKSKDVALLLLSLSILHYFSKAPKEGAAKQFRFATPSEPIFYGSGNLFMGVELEIDNGGESCEAAREFLDIANIRNKHIYCKRDGSIFN